MNNYYATPAPLDRSKRPMPGGWCKLYYLPVDDIASYLGAGYNGMIETNIAPKTGKHWRMLPVPDGEQGYREEQKDGDGGPYVETTITASLPFGSNNNALQLVRMKYEKYLCIIVKRDHTMRVIGSPDAPATMSSNYDNGQRTKASGTIITIKQICEDGPIIYTGAII